MRHAKKLQEEVHATVLMEIAKLIKAGRGCEVNADVLEEVARYVRRLKEPEKSQEFKLCLACGSMEWTIICKTAYLNFGTNDLGLEEITGWDASESETVCFTCESSSLVTMNGPLRLAILLKQLGNEGRVLRALELVAEGRAFIEEDYSPEDILDIMNEGNWSESFREKVKGVLARWKLLGE